MNFEEWSNLKTNKDKELQVIKVIFEIRDLLSELPKTTSKGPSKKVKSNSKTLTKKVLKKGIKNAKQRRQIY